MCRGGQELRNRASMTLEELGNIKIECFKGDRPHQNLDCPNSSGLADFELRAFYTRLYASYTLYPLAMEIR